MNNHAKLLADAELRTPLHYLDAPAEIAGLHCEIGPWKRVSPWIKGRRRGTYEAWYSRGGSETGPTRVASVPAAAVQREDAVLWAIETGTEFMRTTRAITNQAAGNSDASISAW